MHVHPLLCTVLTDRKHSCQNGGRVAKKSGRRGPSTTTITTTQRVMPAISQPSIISLPTRPTSRVILREIAAQYDRRLYDPTTTPQNTNVQKRGQKTPLIYGNVETKRLSTCAKRAIRKQVLFASGVSGSKMRKRSPKRSIWSNIKC